MGLDLLNTTMRPLAAVVSRRFLDDRLGPEVRVRVERKAELNYKHLARDLPDEPTVGACTMVRLAAMTIGFYEAMREAGQGGE